MEEAKSGGRRESSNRYGGSKTKQKIGLRVLEPHYDGGPNCHSLYALDIPDPLPPSRPPKEPNPAAAGGEEQPLPSPLITFPRENYPVGMVAVELDSKLYFLGGVFLQSDDFGPSRSRYARDVYVFDPTCSTTSSPSLSVAPKLNTGKSLPLAFAADSKIYVVSGNVVDGNLCRFEVFENGKWTQLQDPPFHHANLAGHAVVNRKVFISTANQGLFCFDLDSSGWTKIKMPDDDMVGSSFSILSEVEFLWDISEEVAPPFEGRAEFVEDTLYACSRMDVCSFGPLSADRNNKSREEELFGSVTYLSPGVVEQPTWMKYPSVSLTHMGQGRFCYVSVGRPYPVDEYSLDSKKCYVDISVFEVLKETYCSEGEEEERRTYFRGELLLSALFVSESKAWCNEIFGAFTLPS